MKRTISLLLIIASLTATLSCGSEGSSEATTAADTTSAPAVETEPEISDDLPEIDFEGETFNILTRENYDYEFAIEEATGEVIDDAIFNRNTKIEERFNVDITTTPMPCVWGTEANQFNNKLSASIMAGDGAYDLVAGFAATITNLVSQQLFIDWNTLDYIDFTKPWWSERVIDSLTINDKIFTVSGDISVEYMNRTWVCLFNKRVAEDNGLNDIFGIVERGEWTFDKLIELSKGIYRDLDGDTQQGENDIYGLLLSHGPAVDAMQQAFEIPILRKNSDGIPEIAIVNERIVDVLTKLNTYVNHSGDVFFTYNKTLERGIIDMFASGQGLFMLDTFESSEILRSMDDDFGIIPYPKYNKEQEIYFTTVHDEFSLFVLPKDLKNLEMTSIITEALAAEGYKQIIPAFYEITLKGKVSRDDISSRMLDLIREGIIFDYGYLNSTAIGSIGHQFVQHLRADSNDILSYIESNMNTFEAKLDTLLAAYQD